MTASAKMGFFIKANITQDFNLFLTNLACCNEVLFLYRFLCFQIFLTNRMLEQLVMDNILNGQLFVNWWLITGSFLTVEWDKGATLNRFIHK